MRTSHSFQMAVAEDKGKDKKESVTKMISEQFHKTLGGLFNNYPVRPGNHFTMVSETTDANLQVATCSNFNDNISQLSLHQVAREGNVELMEHILERYGQARALKKKKINSKDENELTPLHHAARYHQYGMIKCLMFHGAKVDAIGEDGMTPLHFLAKYPCKHEFGNVNFGKETCVGLLIESGAKLNSKDSMGLSALHHACARGNVAVIKQIFRFTFFEAGDNQGMTPLHYACLYGHLEIVRMLIEKGSKMKSKDKDATTPLHLICADGNIQVAKFFLDKAEAFDKKQNFSNRDPTEIKPTHPTPSLSVELLMDRDNDQNLPIHLAIENGHTKMAMFLIEFCQSKGITVVNEKRNGDVSCLHLAVQANKVEIVKLLVEHGAEVNSITSQYATPLFLACQQNSFNIVTYLLKNNANLEVKDSEMFTPLITAARNGHVETVSILLQNNADINETDKDDKTCMMWAAEENRTDVIKLLLDHSDKKFLEGRDRSNNTGLHLAAMKGNEDSVKLLLEYSAPAELKNNCDRTALHVAAVNGHSTFISYLICKDRSILNAPDEEGNTALHLAAIDGNSKCVYELLQNGANIELRNSKHWTPLHCSAAFGWKKVTQMLLEAGSKVQSKGKIKVCALHLACKRGHPEIVQLLLNWKADVTFKSANGKNALDFALDFSHKECVLPLIKHKTWEYSLKNSVKNPQTGLIDTPMRKLIRTMPEMAEIVLDKCIINHGSMTSEEDYSVTLMYEFLDDTYSCTEWFKDADTTNKVLPAVHVNAKESVVTEDFSYDVYDGDDKLSKAAFSYHKKTQILKQNHPLKIMRNTQHNDKAVARGVERSPLPFDVTLDKNDIFSFGLHELHKPNLVCILDHVVYWFTVSSKCRELLIHPVVTGLLTYKWNHFSRYIYYTNLLVFLIYLFFLNFYIMMLPRFYMIDWHKLAVERREFASGLGNSTHRSSCLYFHDDMPNFMYKEGCVTLGVYMEYIRLTICGFSGFSLALELFTIIRDSGSLKAQQVINTMMNIFAILLCVNYYSYKLEESLQGISDSIFDEIDISYLDGLQSDTGLRQEWQEKVGAFAIFSSWMGLLLVLQNVPLIPNLGVFIAMFIDTLKTFAQFFIILVFFIIGFALSFNVLLGNQALFQRWYESVVAVFVMMIGEMDYSGRFYRRGIGYEERVYTRDASYVMFIIFVTVMTIIIMNLLVGLAVGDIMQVRENATLQRLALQINSTLDIEFFLPQFLRKRFSCRREIIEKLKNRGKYFDFSSHSNLFNILKNYKRSPTDQDYDFEDQVENTSEVDRVLSTLTSMKTRFEHMIDEQAEAQHKIRILNKAIVDLQSQSEQQTKDIKSNVSASTHFLNQRIEVAHNEVLKVNELTQTANNKLDFTQNFLTDLRRKIDIHDDQTCVRFTISENQLNEIQLEIIQRTEALVDLERNLNGEIRKKKDELLDGLEVWREIEKRLSHEIGDVYKELKERSLAVEQLEGKIHQTNNGLNDIKKNIDTSFIEIKAALAHKYMTSDV